MKILERNVSFLKSYIFNFSCSS